MRRLRSWFVLAALGGVLALVVGAGSAAAAYGPTAQYQVAISFNCNNASMCGPDYGGFWGWAVFNTDGSADAELTGCQHLRGGPPGSSGADHFSADIPAGDWFVGPNGDFWISSETDTFVGHGPPVTVTDPSPPYPSDTGVPASPGHWNTSTLFGFTPPPGMSFQIRVTKIPNR